MPRPVFSAHPLPPPPLDFSTCPHSPWPPASVLALILHKKIAGSAYRSVSISTALLSPHCKASGSQNCSPVTELKSTNGTTHPIRNNHVSCYSDGSEVARIEAMGDLLFEAPPASMPPLPKGVVTPAVTPPSREGFRHVPARDPLGGTPEAPLTALPGSAAPPSPTRSDTGPEPAPPERLRSLGTTQRSV